MLFKVGDVVRYKKEIAEFRKSDKFANGKSIATIIKTIETKNGQEIQVDGDGFEFSADSIELAEE